MHGTASDKSVIETPRILPWVVAGVFYLDNFDAAAIVSILPVVARDFGAGVGAASMAVTAYLVALAIFTPVSGWMADRFGGRRVLASALAVFGLGAAGVALASGLTGLVLARAVQGVGGAMMVPVGRVVMMRSFPRSEFVRAMAIVTTPAILGGVLAPSLGGAAATWGSWRWLFWAELPVALAAAVLVLRHVPAGAPIAPRPLSPAAFVLFGVALAGLTILFGMVSAGAASGLLFWGLMAVVLPTGALALWYNRRAAVPLFDFALLRRRSFAAAIGPGTLFFMTAGAVPFLLPMLFQIGLGRNAFESGMFTLVWALVALVMKATTPTVLRRFGFRTVLCTNAAILAAASLGAAMIGPAMPIVVLMGVLVAYGVARSLQFSVVASFTYAEIEPNDVGAATGFAGMVRQLSNSLGVALAAVVLVLIAGGGEPSATDINLTFGILAALPAVAALMFLRLPRDIGAAMSGHLPRGRAAPT
ncbi:MFS transporter [Celeribacter indicus]|uniref:EmrB/QacA family drug resistance transporter n=1 Tax=Celeribacter indicus TaxID=1208324 RepID=A0A0B5DRT8_9RHOB|nr:MFS transporter [Celeribacter indicus]AJE45759.1 EmrB/QacA family drug resistance transporter [Celeribacter indicus]SDX53361.1 Major Facilitator Superfamily protein [Celeribacter indicus]